MSAAKTSNRASAPLCAEFVDGMREAFGDVKVLYVNEGSTQLGEEVKGAVTATMIFNERNKK